jgi:hypothetical protein
VGTSGRPNCSIAISLTMPDVPYSTWFSRLLYRSTLGMAGLLIIAVFASPFLGFLNQPIIALFATDLVLRRTALASAIGLIATGVIFFRRPNDPALQRMRQSQVPIRVGPPTTGLGA